MPQSDDDDLPMQVLKAIAGGVSYRAAARQFGMTESEVRELVRVETDRLLAGDSLREAMALSCARLTQMEIKFFNRAMNESDVGAGILSIRANERRSSLTGSNAPIGHSVRLIGEAAPPQETSTEYFARVIAELRRGHEPERLEADEGDKAGEVTKS